MFLLSPNLKKQISKSKMSLMTVCRPTFSVMMFFRQHSSSQVRFLVIGFECAYLWCFWPSTLPFTLGICFKGPCGRVNHRTINFSNIHTIQKVRGKANYFVICLKGDRAISLPSNAYTDPFCQPLTV